MRTLVIALFLLATFVMAAPASADNEAMKLELERQRLELERQKLQLEREKLQMKNNRAQANQNSCPPPAIPGKCSQRERRNGCGDFRTKAGVGCKNLNMYN